MSTNTQIAEASVPTGNIEKRANSADQREPKRKRKFTEQAGRSAANDSARNELDKDGANLITSTSAGSRLLNTASRKVAACPSTEPERTQFEHRS
jgi:hypothetical protein